MKKGIVTVVGEEHVGIIAHVSKYFADNDISILEISQKIVGGYFYMMMIVDLSHPKKEIDTMIDDLEKMGKKINVQIRLQLEDIFTSMHRI